MWLVSLIPPIINTIPSYNPWREYIIESLMEQVIGTIYIFDFQQNIQIKIHTF